MITSETIPEAFDALYDIEDTLRLVRTVREPTGLFIDRSELVGLVPLMPLARDVARVQPDRLLVVAAAPLDHRGGLYVPGRIVLAERLLQEPDELVRVWSHELAHACDRDRLNPRRSRADAEAFAELLGPLLLEHAPIDLLAAVPLIAEVERAVGRSSAEIAARRGSGARGFERARGSGGASRPALEATHAAAAT